MWPQLVTTLNSTLTAPALAKALQLTAKNKTMQSEIMQWHKAFLSNDSLFYDTSFICILLIKKSPLSCFRPFHKLIYIIYIFSSQKWTVLRKHSLRETVIWGTDNVKGQNIWQYFHVKWRLLCLLSFKNVLQCAPLLKTVEYLLDILQF